MTRAKHPILIATAATALLSCLSTPAFAVGPAAVLIAPWIIGRHVVASVIGLATLASAAAAPPPAYAAPAYATPQPYYPAPRYYGATPNYGGPQYYAAPRYYSAPPYARSPPYYARPQAYYRSYTSPARANYAPARGYDARGARYYGSYGAYRPYSSQRSVHRGW
jgi:hypothetical protein